MKKIIILFLLLILSSSFALAATLKGTIYNTNLEPEKDVLLEIDTQPVQKLLSKEGIYSFNLLAGNYTLTAKKGDLIITEKVTLIQEGEFIYDLFLIPEFTSEEELLQDSQQNLFSELDETPRTWAYFLAGIIFLILLIRIIYIRKKYGSLRLFKRRIKEESKKPLEQHQEELAQKPGYIDQALEIIQKHDGRISQKELRKEMLYLSEAKISLIITELEHRNKIERIKKGRGNILVLKRVEEK